MQIPAGLPAFEYSQIQPGLWAGRNPLFEKDVAELARLGIRQVIDLREPDEWAARDRFGQEALDSLEAYGIRRTYLRIDDQGTPDDEILTRAVAVIQGALDAGEPIYVHCRAGKERTGAVLVAWRASMTGETYWEALAALRASRPILKPMDHQQEAVERWLQQRRDSSDHSRHRAEG